MTSMAKYRVFLSLLVFMVVLLTSLKPSENHMKLPEGVKYKLSEYGFFRGDPADQIPVEGIMPYSLNTPLFSDYAEKLRFVKIPAGKAAEYREREVLDFPVGTVLIKTFYYPEDMRKPEKGRRLLETRLLMHEKEGWFALPYIWNEAQTDADLEVAGGSREISWRNHDGKKMSLQYSVPNINQCKGCHVKDDKIKPIGPSARQLNGDFLYTNGEENQLRKWAESALLKGLPELHAVARLPVWDEPSSGSLDERARAYLDINCAHCHNAAAPANTSGLLLDYFQTDTTALGMFKTPVAAGRGSGGRQYDILPGHSRESILWYRMASEDPGEMMPELGRKLVHQEGVALIEAWINALDK